MNERTKIFPGARINTGLLVFMCPSNYQALYRAKSEIGKGWSKQRATTDSHSGPFTMAMDILANCEG